MSNPSSPVKAPTVPVYENTNGVPLANGKNLHMGVTRGELANRIVTVGSASRAEKIASWLDADPAINTVVSSRGFTTISGYYKGSFVSIVAIGMGVSMMDFFVRESRAVVSGPMAIIRFGTCGGLTTQTRPGCVVVATGGSGYVSRNPDAFADNYNDGSKPTGDPYVLHKVTPANQELSNMLVSNLSRTLPAEHVMCGTNVTADSFYSSQGRIDKNFEDSNENLHEKVLNFYPDAKTMEMESFVLLNLALCCKETIKASAAAIVVANRPTGEVLDGELLDDMERCGGHAVLDAIVSIPL